MVHVLLIVCIVLGAFCLMPIADRILPPKTRRFVGYFVFLVYLLGNLSETLLFRDPLPEIQVQLQLFHAYRQSFSLDYGVLGTVLAIFRSGLDTALDSIHITSADALKGVILNILLYVPMGYLLPWVFPRLTAPRKGKTRRHLGRVVLIGFLASLATEVTQLLLQIGCFEMDDLLDNTLGTVIGVFMFWLFIQNQMKKKA